MYVPLRYNLRNLIERKGTTLMTALGIALTVAVLVIALSLINGLAATFAGTGRADQVVVLRKGVTAELNSSVNELPFQELKLMPGVATGAGGLPLASPELIAIVNLPSVDSPAGMNVTVRGLTPVGLGMRELTLVGGRWFEPGKREVVVGDSVARRYADARVGNTIRFGRGRWTIVGVFTGGGRSAANSEIWADLNQLRADYDRQGNMSSVLVRLTSPAAVPAFATAVEANQRLASTALPEPKYYENMTRSGAPLKYLGTFVAVIMAVGSGFGAMNTMYAAVARRTREIGTLRALGFPRRAILSSFMLESLVLSLVGGALGVLIALPMNGVQTGIGNFDTFSEVAFNFKVDARTAGWGLLFAATIGAAGGFLPAMAAARRDLLTALREL